MGKFDIAVIGGGASGLLAAIAAASLLNGKGSVAVLEKNTRVGKKLLMTGNGRCNLTNLQLGPENYHGDVKRMEPVLHRYPPEKILRVFRSYGLLCREQDAGRVYPYNLQASAVLNVLRRILDRSGVKTLCDFPVESIRKTSNGFLLGSSAGTTEARRVVVATGGKACPKTGSDGNGYSLLRSLGHTVIEPCPALVPVKTEVGRTRPLKGIRCPATATLKQNGKALRSAKGEVQFTEYGLSGICIFDLSRSVGQNETAKGYSISLDLMPEYSKEHVLTLLREFAEQFPNLPVAQLGEGILHKSLAVQTVKSSGLDIMKPAGTLTAEEKKHLTAVWKNFPFPVTGTMSWNHAQVTAGGIPLAETDEALQSRRCPGVYLCGELLNIDGDCGGFNLHWAWSSGLLAGNSAAVSL